MVFFFKTLALFVITAIAEIAGCYLPYLWLREGRSPWLLVPAALSLALFAWLLTLHPTGAARTYAAYGGVYISVALLWLWAVERQRPTGWDWVGFTVPNRHGDHCSRPTSRHRARRRFPEPDPTGCNSEVNYPVRLTQFCL